MKKFIIIFTGFLFMIAGTFAQERTVNLAGGNNLVNTQTTKVVNYNGNTADRLIPTIRDTIDYYVTLSNYDPGPQHFYAVFTFDTIAGADTTVAITVQGKKFANESYTDIIASDTTDAISAQANVTTSLGVVTEFTETLAGGVTTTRLANTLLRYRYLKFRLILTGNDTVGTGIKVKNVRLIFF